MHEVEYRFRKTNGREITIKGIQWQSWRGIHGLTTEEAVRIAGPGAEMLWPIVTIRTSLPPPPESGAE